MDDNTSAPVWMNLQAKYDLAVAEQEFGKMISERIKPASIEVADGTRSTAPRIANANQRGKLFTSKPKRRGSF